MEVRVFLKKGLAGSYYEIRIGEVILHEGRYGCEVDRDPDAVMATGEERGLFQESSLDFSREYQILKPVTNNGGRGAMGEACKICSLILCLLLSFHADAVDAAVYYVKKGGTKILGPCTPGNWDDSNCYGSIGAAVGRMDPGDESVVDDGAYSEGIGDVPSGNTGAYSVVRSRNPLRVTLGGGISVSGGSFVHVDGFRLNKGFISVKRSDHVKVTRCLVRGSGKADKVVEASGHSSYIVFEDIAFCGSYRYAFFVGGTDDSSNHVIFRRCLFRGDYTMATQPFSGFAVYGHNSSAASGSHHIAYQNCIAIDSNSSAGAKNPWKHTPWYIFKGNHDVIMDGCITLNNDQSGMLYGFMRNHYGGYNSIVRNSVWWDNKCGKGAPFFFRGGSSGHAYVENCTFGSQCRGLDAELDTSDNHLINSLFVRVGASVNGSFGSARYNSFDDPSQSLGSSVVPYKRDLKYIMRVESDSNRYRGGKDGHHVGAHIVKRLGTSGSLWGDPGWNTETNENLWPWPYENEIGEWFRAENSPPAKASPSLNQTGRGFAVEGQTLTKYLWGYLGNDLPPGSYDDKKAPVDLMRKPDELLKGE